MLARMRRFARPLAAVALVAFAAIGAVERAALHAHPLEENDLVPHELLIVEAGFDCSGSVHLDAARRVDHPVCAECVLAASAIAVGPSAAVGLAESAPARLGVRPVAIGRETRGEHAAPARAPPAA